VSQSPQLMMMEIRPRYPPNLSGFGVRRFTGVGNPIYREFCTE
jgi:hypothetical protein